MLSLNQFIISPFKTGQKKIFSHSDNHVYLFKTKVIIDTSPFKRNILLFTTGELGITENFERPGKGMEFQKLTRVQTMQDLMKSASSYSH